jgi:hypothetical protein
MDTRSGMEWRLNGTLCYRNKSAMCRGYYELRRSIVVPVVRCLFTKSMLSLSL